MLVMRKMTTMYLTKTDSRGPYIFSLHGTGIIGEAVRTGRRGVVGLGHWPSHSWGRTGLHINDNNQDWQPTEVAGEIKVHNKTFEEEESISADSGNRWGKIEKLSLDSHVVPSSSDAMQQHKCKDIFEIFKLFLTPDII